MTNNKSTTIFLINDHVRMVEAVYENHKGAESEFFKTFRKDLAKDDYIIVESNSRHNLSVVKVIDPDIEFDPEMTAHVHWVVDRVDTETHEEVLIAEAKALDMVRSAQKRKKKAELREALLDDKDALDNLAIAHYGEVVEAPPTSESEWDRPAQTQPAKNPNDAPF